jgi:hypothetical protein
MTYYYYCLHDYRFAKGRWMSCLIDFSNCLLILYTQSIRRQILTTSIQHSLRKIISEEEMKKLLNGKREDDTGDCVT